MRRAHSSRQIALLRRFLLVAAVVVVVAVGGLLWIGRAGRGADEVQPAESEQPLAENALTYEARGFDHTVSIGDRPIFRIQAARTSTTGQGETPRLQQVTLTYYRQGGSEYTITSSFGQYDLKTQAARLEGQVMVHAPNGLTLRTQGLQLSPHADWLVSSTSVQLSMGETMRGTALGLRANLKDSIYILQKDVLLSGTSDNGDALALRCDRLSYERQNRTIRAEGNVLLRYGDDLIHARRVSALLDENERNLKFVNAHWQVTGELRTQATASGGGTALTNFAADSLLAEFGPDGKVLQNLQLQGSGGVPAWVLQKQPDGVVRKIQSAEIDGAFAAGNLQRLHTPSKADLEETSGLGASAVTRTSTAGRLEVTFGPDGTPSSAEFLHGVQVTDGERQVVGDRGNYDAARDTITILGDPATVTEPERVMNAPHFDYTLGAQTVHGEGGVRIRFAPGGKVSLPGASGADSEQPVQVEAATLDADTRAGTFRLDGNVRAWQGENYLLANSLTGDNTGETMIAEGKVKTVWKQQAASPQGGTGEIRTIDASGSRLEYARSVHHMTYFGPATVREGPRRMQCERIDAQLDEQDRARGMTCTGSVQITDPETGRRATGDRADYAVDSALIHMTGSPVVLHQGDGSKIEGARLIYNLDDGTATIQSSASEQPGTPAEPGAPATAAGPATATPESAAQPAPGEAVQQGTQVDSGSSTTPPPSDAKPERQENPR